MNNVYYGVSPSSDFFAHYGVKGMKWGVRRAIKRGNQKALAKHYFKAQKKLKKLSDKADIRVQKNKLNKYNNLTRHAIGKGAAAGGIGASLGYLHAAHNAASKYGLPIGSVFGIPKIQQLGIATGVAGLAAGALGSYAGKKIRQQIYKNRLSDKGHAKASKKYNDWMREMALAFSGTKYRDQMDRKYYKEVDKKIRAYEKDYNNAISRGMTHDQAVQYTAKKIHNRNSYNPINNKRRRKH